MITIPIYIIRITTANLVLSSITFLLATKPTVGLSERTRATGGFVLMLTLFAYSKIYLTYLYTQYMQNPYI
jgi:hypothetical protein